MGSIIDKPKAPTIIYPTAEPEITSDTSAEDAAAAEAAEAERRAKALAKMFRGNNSLINTSTRGIFSLNDLVPQRKSLLGE